MNPVGQDTGRRVGGRGQGIFTFWHIGVKRASPHVSTGPAWTMSGLRLFSRRASKSGEEGKEGRGAASRWYSCALVARRRSQLDAPKRRKAWLSEARNISKASEDADKTDTVEAILVLTKLLCHGNSRWSFSSPCGNGRQRYHVMDSKGALSNESRLLAVDPQC